MIRIAIDIGGTFTDGIALDAATGAIRAAKVLTTPDDPGIAAQQVIAELLRQGRDARDRSAAAEVVHATTLVTNALIERRGARLAFLLSAGTRDVLDIRRELRYDLYDLDIHLPEALLPRAARIEVAERLGAAGEVLQPLTEEAIADAIAALRAQPEPPEAVAICFLHAYREPAHERAVGEAVQAALPGTPVSLSSAIARESGEYERMSTTVANAYVQPLVRDYLAGFGRRVAELGLDAPVRIMVSGGGFTTPEAASAVPVHLLESGPAGGVLSAMNTAAAQGVSDILAFDMGGTTAKACLVLGGNPSVARSFEAARVHRFKRGSGLPILGTSVDPIEIGAGGGSLARPSPLGLLSVGPESAGAVPGPACYARGGTEPTVTDADLVLGYLDPQRFLGGTMPLSRPLADAALARLGDRLAGGGRTRGGRRAVRAVPAALQGSLRPRDRGRQAQGDRVARHGPR